jgi:bifunctional UDP-N-acetylglucosamine pyrophosphorylase/glucosamine-1-phosphate N-acetyltransferase
MVHAGTIVILAAGKGKRMKSAGPKVLHELCGRPILGYVLDQARALGPERIAVVTGHGGDEVREWVLENEPAADSYGSHGADGATMAPVAFVHQAEQRGTGHAVRMAADEIGRSEGPVIVLYGDMPLITAASLEALIDARGDGKASMLTAIADQPRGFGRIVREDGAFRAIIEEKDATPDERAIREANVGVYCFDRNALLEGLPRLSTDNAQGELYLTDVLGTLVDEGGDVATVTLDDEREAIGINTIEHLSEARAGIQRRILSAHMANGVFVEDPASTYVDHGVEIGAGTRILPCTVIRAGVTIGADCEVGPFTHLRAGTVLKDRAELGNFTEAKKSTVGEGTKAKHLTYLGDVDIGSGANIGAGTIVANYDGTHKHRTTVGDGAFIGSGSILIAPMTVGEGALTGAGAVVKRGTDIPPRESWVGVPAHPIAPKSNETDD